jgi:muramoyltetrapeptide carboxypeptidase
VIKPAALNKGDKICIVSPSSEIKSFPRRLQRGIKSLESQGFEVVLSNHSLALKGKEAGTAKERANDLMQAFQDTSVKCIMASTGGYTANTVLEYLNFETIKSNPKILIGFSDITALLNAIYFKTGLITFHGPTLLSSFGDAAGVHQKTMSSFISMTCNKNLVNDNIGNFLEYSEDGLLWDIYDDEPQKYKKDTGIMWLTEGNCEGKIVGGNLDTLLGILNTEYCPNFSNSILLLEESGGCVAKTVRSLKTLEHTSVLNNIKALVYGRSFQYEDNNQPNSLHNLIKEIGHKLNIPVLFNVPFGHTEPKHTIPIGVLAKIDFQNKIFRISESAVS